MLWILSLHLIITHKKKPIFIILLLFYYLLFIGFEDDYWSFVHTSYSQIWLKLSRDDCHFLFLHLSMDDHHFGFKKKKGKKKIPQEKKKKTLVKREKIQVTL